MELCPYIVKLNICDVPLSVIRESCITTTRACGTDAAPRVVRLSKEERQKLAFQFVEKFKAGNNGQLPSINLLRKEVGGSYDILKEVIQDFEKGLSDKVANEKTVDLKKIKTKKDSQPVEVATQISNAAKKDEHKKKSSSKEKIVNMEATATVDDPHEKEEAKEKSSSQDQHDKEDVGKESVEKDKDGRKIQSLSRKEKEPGQNKKSTPQSLEERQSLKQADAKLSSDDTKKEKKSSVLTEDTLESLMDSMTTDEDRDEDDDSDVAAPEYQQSSTMQIKGHTQARGGNLKVDSAVNKDDDESIKSRLPLREKDFKVKDMQKGLDAVKSMIQSMAKQPWSDLSSGSGSGPPTNVLRIVNLPTHTSAHQLRSVCESVAKVHGVSLRRGRIADVHFAVDPREINVVLDRLRKMAIGNVSLKVFPALRFSCESSMSGGFGARDANQFKYVRNGLINAFEQRLKFLCFQVQDFRELHNLKVEK
ncbi:hypothetical protein L7F22_023108 [Adiantum nelumboides]|nr:hypothetical protein [Adiantum nelumboides]